METSPEGCEGCSVAVHENCHKHYLLEVERILDCYIESQIKEKLKKELSTCPCSTCIVKGMCEISVNQCAVYKRIQNEKCSKVGISYG